MKIGHVLLFRLLLSVSLAAPGKAGDAFHSYVDGVAKAPFKFGIPILQKCCNDSRSIALAPLFIHHNLCVLSGGMNDLEYEPIARVLLGGGNKLGHNKIDRLAFMFATRTSEIIEEFFYGKNFCFFNGFFIEKDAVLERGNLPMGRILSHFMVDFANPVEAAKRINDWVKNSTMSRVTSIVSEGLLARNASIVAAGVAYYKARWHHGFDKMLTRKKPFYQTVTKQREVEMMERRGMFMHGSNEAMDVLQMDMEWDDPKAVDPNYKPIFRPRDKSSIFIFLPKDKFGLSQIEESIRVNVESIRGNGESSRVNKASFERIVAMHKEDVIVKLPKFKIENELDLSETIKQLGFSEMFKENAFSQMSNTSLSLTKFIHKCVIEVSEEGGDPRATDQPEAAGSGEVQTTPKQPIVFNADHPFFFVIAKEEAVLVIGHVR